MRVLLINSVCGTGSTGRICADLAKQFEKEGHEVRIAYGRVKKIPQEMEKYGYYIGSAMEVRFHGLLSKTLDFHGRGSVFATKRFLKWAEKYQPDLLWLHNLHGYYINYPMLFSWIKKHPQMEVRWTLHDAWPLTGHCAHFMESGCAKWQTHCGKCEYGAKYPSRLFIDSSFSNFEKKKQAFCHVKNLTLITPSQWLADTVKKSFLREYPVTVVHNEINRNVFQPTESSFRKAYDLDGKTMLLGVASPWTKEKGLDDFIRLSKMLRENEKIVLIGLSKEQLKRIPPEIIGLSRTQDAPELAGIYSTADLFLNLTYEDNYPTVNLEAEACGTPVISYDTGGCRETLQDPRSRTVPTGDLEQVLRIVRDEE